MLCGVGHEGRIAVILVMLETKRLPLGGGVRGIAIEDPKTEAATEEDRARCIAPAALGTSSYSIYAGSVAVPQDPRSTAGDSDVTPYSVRRDPVTGRGYQRSRVWMLTSFVDSEIEGWLGCRYSVIV